MKGTSAARNGSLVASSSKAEGKTVNKKKHPGSDALEPLLRQENRQIGQSGAMLT